MSDSKISQLTALSGTNIAADDLLVVVDNSSSETKKLAVSDLLSSSSFGLLSNNTIPIAKVSVSAGSIAGTAIADVGITTSKIALDAVNATILSDNSSAQIVTSLPSAGGFVGQIAVNSAATYTASIWDGSAWQSLKAAAAITAIASDASALINIATTMSGTTATLAANVADSSAAAQFVAGPTGAGGTVTLRTITGSDLPLATSTAQGTIKINGEGLRIDTGVIEIDNDITASSAYNLVTLTSKGLVSAYRTITANDLPAGTDAVKGALQVGTGLSVSSGVVSLANTTTAGTFSKGVFNSNGLLTSGSNLIEADIPDHSAAKLTTGTLDAARIGANSIGREKFSDTSICVFTSVVQSGLPSSSEFKGEFLFDTTDKNLYIHDSTAWQPVSNIGGGSLFNSYAMLSQRATSNGGAISSADTWFARDLTNVEFDQDSIVTLNTSNSRFTLQAGSYFIKAKAPLTGIVSGMSRLYNVTDSEVALNGLVDKTSGSTSSTWGQSLAPLSGRITITSAKAFEYQQIVSDAQTNTMAKGAIDSDFFTNGTSYSILTEIEIYKEA